MSTRVCGEPGCPELLTDGTVKCLPHSKRKPDDQRPNATVRGYGSAWRRVRNAFIAEHPTCALCPAPTKVADHHPASRRELLDAGVVDVDDPSRLRPLCLRCHAAKSGGQRR